jgi:RNA polymerase sigma factor (sigma-70 family)
MRPIGGRDMRRTEPVRRGADAQSVPAGRPRSKASAPSAVTAAFLESGSFLKKFLSRFLPMHQDIEDVAQEAYLRAYVAEQREAIEQPKAFLFRVAKNLALTSLSKKSQRITDYIEEAGESVVIDTAAASDEEVEAQQCFGIYCEAVASLPEKCRQVFLLRKVHGLSHKEIGERLGLSISSVEKYLREGILTCQAQVAQHEGSMPNDAARSRGKGGSWER